VTKSILPVEPGTANMAAAGSEQQPGMETCDKKKGMWKTRMNNLQSPASTLYSNISIS